jgi:hypothetical protein
MYTTGISNTTDRETINFNGYPTDGCNDILRCGKEAYEINTLAVCGV